MTFTYQVSSKPAGPRLYRHPEYAAALRRYCWAPATCAQPGDDALDDVPDVLSRRASIASSSRGLSARPWHSLLTHSRRGRGVNPRAGTQAGCDGRGCIFRVADGAGGNRGPRPSSEVIECFASRSSTSLRSARARGIFDRAGSRIRKSFRRRGRVAVNVMECRRTADIAAAVRCARGQPGRRSAVSSTPAIGRLR